MVEIFAVASPLAPGKTDLESMTRNINGLEASNSIDRLLVGYSALWPHNQVVAPYLLAMTKKLSPIVAHRPGVMHPTAAARYFATLDTLSGSRLALNIVVGGSDKDLQREGDYLPKAERYERAIEYLDVMKRTWSEPESFSHEGKYYKAEGVHPLIRPVHGHVPIFMGGESDEAVEFGATHADLYMLWGEPIKGTDERVRRVREAAKKHGRSPRFSLSLRLFIGETDDQAWERAHAAKQTIIDAAGTHKFMKASASDKSVGVSRSLALASQELHDDCFWTGLVPLLGGFANSAALVGTPDRILKTLRQYTEMGIDSFLLTTNAEGSWDPAILEDFALRAKKELNEPSLTTVG